MSDTLAVPAHLRAARAAVATCFFVNAVLYANLVPRLPEVKDRLDLSNAALGAAIAALPLGALVSALASAALMRRFGSARVASWGLVALAGAIWGAAVSPSWWLLATALFVAGALDAVVDVAQNAHGLRVQRAYDRSILNAFHGLWSVGAVGGGLLGSAAAGLRVPLAVHLGVVAAVFAVVALVAYRRMLPGPDHEEPVDDDGAPPAGRAGMRASLGAMAALGVLATCGAFVEDAGSSWAALYLRGEVGTGVATAGLGFVALSVAMTVGRLTGDRVVDRFGQRRVARGGGALIAVGMGLALAVPSLATTLVGFALAGLGVATLVPAVYAAADELPGLRHGVGLTVVNWLLRIGFLASPPLVGAVADATSLRVGLLGVVLAGVVTLVLGRVLRPTVSAAR
ncbi:MFS transporter [Geodermatophilus nigrescens]|uniref:Fucose permease n=1 Tax=Geodermatophilus nigrescens TaxID=1070870 RepID=A0A1M5QT21_9ACTN|nr:MFS transporter [Geodermatophilus nigrescens]SHH17305.1 Fucose permease [Geodermatophilus nigrescens]